MNTPTETPLTTLIKEMRESSEKATQGQWLGSIWHGPIEHPDGRHQTLIPHGPLHKWTTDEDISTAVDDSYYIALCNPQNIRRLLDALDEAWAEIERLKNGSS